MKQSIKFHLQNKLKYKREIEEIDKAIEWMRERIAAPRIMSYELREGSAGTSYAAQSKTERDVLQLESDLSYRILLEEKRKRQIIMQKLDYAMQLLEPLEKDIIEYRFEKKWSAQKVAMELGYERSWINRKENRAIRQMEKKIPAVVLRDIDIELSAAGL